MGLGNDTVCEEATIWGSAASAVRSIILDEGAVEGIEAE